MKKNIVKFTIIAISLLIIVPIFKNLYLYFHYQHDKYGFIKIEGKPGVITGTWRAIFDTHQCGIDERHEILYIFYDDSSGVENHKFYDEKILADFSNVYSWKSLLPYNKEKVKISKTKIKIKSYYLIYLPDLTTSINDTLYSKFKVNKDTLFIDSYKWKNEYSEEPTYKFLYSNKPNFFKLFQFWYEYI